MTFDDILAQILDLLQRQGRVSYGALKRRFDLDDAYLEDLKDEIIHAQRLATDEDGRILVWTGHVEGTTEQPLHLTRRHNNLLHSTISPCRVCLLQAQHVHQKPNAAN